MGSRPAVQLLLRRRNASEEGGRRNFLPHVPSVEEDALSVGNRAPISGHYKPMVGQGCGNMLTGYCGTGTQRASEGTGWILDSLSLILVTNKRPYSDLV